MSTARRRMTSPIGNIGPVTKWLCIAVIVVSAVGAMAERAYGLGSSLLIFSVDGVLSLELWRFLTFPLVEVDPMRLLLDLVFFFFLGRSFEPEWGSRYFAWFFALASVGAALLAIPLTYAINLVAPFHDLGAACGPSAAVTAMFMALAIQSPDANILLGFVLPMRARTAIYLFLGVELLFGIMSGAATLSITLGGMFMGWILITGNWRPQRVLTRIRLWRSRRKRRGLQVIDGKNGPTLH